MDFGPLVAAFSEHPAAAIAAIEALALGFLFRELLKSQNSNIQTALSIAPVAQKLAESVSALERVFDRLHNRG